MTALRVLYLGDSGAGSTSLHRAQALRRLGATVRHVDPYRLAGRALSGWRGSLHYRTGYRFLARALAAEVGRAADSAPFDLCWVDNGELLDEHCVAFLASRHAPVVLFNHDDPTGSRDGSRFNLLRRAIKRFTLCIVVRAQNVDEYSALGAPAALRVWMGYDEVAHAPGSAAVPVAPRFVSDVAFIGRNIPGERRDAFLVALVEAGIDVAVWGSNWQSSKHWPTLESHWRGADLSGSDYVDAIRGSKLCLGMLSKGNRDQHTTRSMEIPYAGGVLCAERTDEHRALYEEGVEAVFWGDVNECVALCRQLLADGPARERIRAAGRNRVLRNRVGNEDICRAALSALGLEAVSREADPHLHREGAV